MGEPSESDGAKRCSAVSQRNTTTENITYSISTRISAADTSLTREVETLRCQLSAMTEKYSALADDVKHLRQERDTVHEELAELRQRVAGENVEEISQEKESLH